MNTSLADWYGYYLGFFLASVALVLAWLRRGAGSPDVGSQEPARLSPSSLLVILAGSMILYAIMAQRVTYLIGFDEYFRAAYSHDWARDHFFATYDHVWLPGQFYILGAVFQQLGDMALAVTITSVLGYLATVYLSARLSFLLWRNQAAAVVSALLVAGHWVVLWGALNPIAEVFSWPCLLWGLERFLSGWIDEAEGSRERERAWFFAALATGLGTMFRFEEWYAGIVLGFFFVARIGFSVFRRRWIAVAVSCVCALVIAIFPVSYLISSWRVLGSPVAFAKAGAEMNAGGNLFYDLSSPLSRFLIYPKALFQDHWNWLPMPLGAMLLLARRDLRARLLPFLSVLGALLLFSMLVTMKSGVGSNLKQRYTMFLLIPMLSLVGGAIRLLWEQERGKVFLRGTTAVWLVLTLFGSMKIALHYYPNAYGIHPDDLEIVDRIEHDREESRIWLDYPRMQPKGKYLFVYSKDMFNVVRYHSPEPNLVRQVNDDSHLKLLMNTEKEGRRFLLRKPVPKVNYPPRMAKVLETGSWEVWEVRGTGKSPNP